MTAHRLTFLTCQAEDDEGPCGITSIPEFFTPGRSPRTVQQAQDEAHRAGWTRPGGRDICPGHSEDGAR